MKINKELLKGTTTMLILNLLDSENMYGYQIIKKLKEKSNNVFNLNEGSLYPILHKLEEKKYVISYWEEQNKKPKKYYSITPLGKKFLTEKKNEWNFFSKEVTLCLGGDLFAY